MGEVGGAFIELEPADHAVIGEILCHARFGDAQMFGKLRLEGIRATAACATAQKISDGDAQSLARLNIIIAGEVRIGEDENAGTDGSVVRFAKFYGRTGQQPAKLHFQERQSRGQTGIAGTAAHARPARFANRFDGECRNRGALGGGRRSGLGRFLEYS